LRGLLLNAYAFDTMGSIAGIAAVAAYVAAAFLLVLSALGWWHSGRESAAEPVFPGLGATAPPQQS
jgi:hypothetical protein